MAKKLTPAKAKEILHDGTVHGKPLTNKQRRFFGAMSNMAKGGLNVIADDGTGIVYPQAYPTTSAGPNYAGEGYSTEGRDYSPAWGGSFQRGGQVGQAGLKIKIPRAKESNTKVKDNIESALALASLITPKPWNYIPSLAGSAIDFYDAYKATNSSDRNQQLIEGTLGLLPPGMFKKAVPDRFNIYKNSTKIPKWTYKALDVLDPLHAVNNLIDIKDVVDPNYKNGGLIKRADGSYSQHGLWDSIRENKGSGKKPTKEMLKQEKKIKAKEMEMGGYLPTAQQGRQIDLGKIPVQETYMGRPIPSVNQIIEKGRNENKKIVQERKNRIKASQEARKRPLSAQQFADETQAIGDKLRLFPNDPNNVFDEYINPGVFIGNLASGLGRIPLNLQQGNYGEAAWNLAAPAVVGALSKIGNKNKFESEIDWSKWNSEIPSNKTLMNEYNAIEKTSKANGKWMKNPDGSAFQGTPEQFVQQNSQNFKKAYPQGFTTGYRGAHQHIDNFADRDASHWATFLTDNLKNAESYASESNGRFFQPGESQGAWVDGLYELAIPNHAKKVIGNAEGRNWRLLNYDDKIAKGSLNKDFAQKFQDDLKKNAVELYDLQDYNPNKQYLSTDIYANYVKNPKNPEAIAEIKQVQDQMGFATDIPANTVYAVDANRSPLKSLRYNNGMFDMTNPNIYKALLPGAVGLAALNQKQMGGALTGAGGMMYARTGQDWKPKSIGEAGLEVPVSSQGLYDYPQQTVDVPTSNGMITMQGIDYPVLGTDENGEQQVMQPGGEYQFSGQMVREVPLDDSAEGNPGKQVNEALAATSPYDNNTTYRDLVKNAAKAVGVDPRMLWSSSFVEGMGLLVTHPDKVSSAYNLALDKDAKLQDYQIDGFYNYGLDNFGDVFPTLVKKGYLPKDFDYHTFKAMNEQKKAVNTAAFKNNYDAIRAKAAYLRHEGDRVKQHANKLNLKLSPDEQSFFTMAAYNGGLGSAQAMLDALKKSGLSAEDYIRKGKTPKGQVYKNIKPRYDMMAELNDIFEAGGTITTEQDRGQLKKLDQLINFSNYNYYE